MYFGNLLQKCLVVGNVNRTVGKLATQQTRRESAMHCSFSEWFSLFGWSQFKRIHSWKRPITASAGFRKSHRTYVGDPPVASSDYCESEWSGSSRGLSISCFVWSYCCNQTQHLFNSGVMNINWFCNRIILMVNKNLSFFPEQILVYFVQRPALLFRVQCLKSKRSICYSLGMPSVPMKPLNSA